MKFTKRHKIDKDTTESCFGKINVQHAMRDTEEHKKVSDKDGNINLQDFLRFYYVAASGSNPKAVQSNLKNHNVRLDLKKMSEVVDEVSYAQHEMPRYTLSAN